MKRILLIAILGLALLPSCLKKIDGADQLNSNIFDENYLGPPWYLITDAFVFNNSFGQQLLKIEYEIAPDVAPKLKASFVPAAGGVNVLVPTTADFLKIQLNSAGGYSGEFVVPYSSTDSYQVTLGIMDVDDSSIINVITQEPIF